MTDANFEYLRSLIDHRLRGAVTRLRHRFPSVDIQLLDGEIGQLTSYRGYQLGIDCDLSPTGEPRSLTLEVAVRGYRSEAAQLDCAQLVWGRPDGDIEAELFDGPRALTHAVSEELATGLGVLLSRLEAALEARVAAHLAAMSNDATKCTGYVRDLVMLFRKLGAAAEAQSGAGDRATFHEGRAAGLREALQFMKSQAEIFGLSESELGLEGFNPLLDALALPSELDVAPGEPGQASRNEPD